MPFYYLFLCFILFFLCFILFCNQVLTKALSEIIEERSITCCWHINVLADGRRFQQFFSPGKWTTIHWTPKTSKPAFSNVIKIIVSNTFIFCTARKSDILIMDTTFILIMDTTFIINMDTTIPTIILMDTAFCIIMDTTTISVTFFTLDITASTTSILILDITSVIRYIASFAGGWLSVLKFFIRRGCCSVNVNWQTADKPVVSIFL